MFQLIATFMIGVLAASVSYILYTLSRRRIPRAIIPFAAAIAMIAYNVWHEMTWYKRTAAALPEGIVLVAKGPPVESPMSPWTYVYPRTDSFLALDTRTVQPLPKSDSRYLFQVLDVGRFYAARRTSRIVDCAAREEATIDATTKFDAEGLPSGLAWSKIPAGNRIVEVVCPNGAAKMPAAPAVPK